MKRTAIVELGGKTAVFAITLHGFSLLERVMVALGWVFAPISMILYGEIILPVLMRKRWKR